MTVLLTVPVDSVDGEALAAVEQVLGAALPVTVRRLEPMAMPATAFDPVRRQFEATHVLRALLERLEGTDDRGLAVANQDLFIPMLSFVFGQAQLRGRASVVSLARLRPSFYALPDNPPLLLSRLRKEALHEVGHLFGLVHCPDRRCAMTLSNTVQQIDQKDAEYCAGCRVLIADALTPARTDHQ